MADIQHIIQREEGLPAVLGTTQMAGVAFGAVIGYGLLTGGVLPLALAGPVGVPAYVAAACVVLLLMQCLAAMAAAHPVPSAFGAYAEAYLGAHIGRIVRAAYFIGVVCIVGTEVLMMEPLLNAWLAPLPGWCAIIMLLTGLGIVNALSARASARFGLALVVLKIVALAALVGLAVYQALIAADVTPQGGETIWTAIWMQAELHSFWQATVVAVLGFIGIETMAVAAGETAAPARARFRGMRAATWGILVLTLITVTASAWFQAQHRVPFNVPPFVYLLELAGGAVAGAAFNVLMLLAVISVLNSQIYAGSRQLYGLQRAYRSHGVPNPHRAGGAEASVACTIVFASLLYLACRAFPTQVYTATTSIAMTLLLAVWGAIFASHIRFRRQAGGMSWQGMIGSMLVLVIAASTLLIDAFGMALLIGIPCLLMLSLLVYLSGRCLSCQNVNK